MLVRRRSNAVKRGKAQKVVVVGKRPTKNQLINRLLANNLRRGPIKDRLMTTMAYAVAFTATIAGAVNIEALFRLNSLFDPDLTGVGHQPYGRDLFATMYNRYRVWKCRYEVSMQPSQTQPLVLAVIPSNSTTPLSGNIDLALELAGSKYKLISTGTGNPKITGVVDLPTLEGVTRAEYAGSDRYQELQAGNPSENAILHVIIGNTSGSSITYNYVVKLVYYVELFDPIQQGQS